MSLAEAGTISVAEPPRAYNAGPAVDGSVAVAIPVAPHTVLAFLPASECLADTALVQADVLSADSLPMEAAPALQETSRGISEETFIQLYNQHYATVLAYVSRRLSRDLQTAENITQQIFTNVWVGRARIASHTGLSYLYRAAHHEVIDEYRRRNGKGATFSFDEDGDEALLTEMPHSEVFTDSRVIAALGRLRDEQRMSTMLRLMDFQPWEVAESMGISPGSERILYLRARNNLRAELAGYRSEV